MGESTVAKCGVEVAGNDQRLLGVLPEGNDAFQV